MLCKMFLVIWPYDDIYFLSIVAGSDAVEFHCI